MKETKRFRNLAEATAAYALYCRADEEWGKWLLEPAFRHMRQAAKAGVEHACGPLGQFYEEGLGTEPDTDAALYWYRKAHRCGDKLAARDIGCILRGCKKTSRAVQWLKRAVRRGVGDANLTIARIYLQDDPDRDRAIRYLRKTSRSHWPTERAQKEAAILLKQLTSEKIER